ncbi:MAG: cytochrome c-type biogenesis protein [Methylotenera sp.]|nr:cytochrome c-type biogenesis protein CcmH [Methylotenera sp.]
MKLNQFVKLLVVFCLTYTASAWAAQEARPMQDNAAVEAQVQRLSTELRCLVCQNQTLADSHAELAEDLKQEIREMAAKGMTDQAIIDYLVERYGDFVRYRPPLKASTVLLWVGPFALLLAGGFGLFLKLRGRQKMNAEAPLSEEEARKVNELLNKES